MTIEEFVDLVGDELGLEVTPADIGRHFDELPGWDSMHLLGLLTTLEGASGRQLSLPHLLEATNLEQLYLASVA
ncbi:acyl carrier protein [Micromonospora lupini]|uniref:acyl carrier protein n=1 Tax=Micromonospora lupini TaxID=285679 RepID=UPI0033EF2DDC